MKKVFICCSADRRLVLEAKAQVYKKWELTEQLERADLMAVVTFKPSIAPTVSRGERRTDGTAVSRQLGNRTLQRDGNCRE